MKPHRHHGFSCLVQHPPLCRAITTVLSRVRRRAPKDFARLRLLVRKFAPLPQSDARKGVQGRWQHRGEYWRFDQPGAIQLNAECSAPIALLAHELGHACTREADFENRAGFDDEWTGEMCADYYAYKWGFGREISRNRRNRDLGHHGPGPGVFTFGPAVPDGADVVYRYRVTRHFHIRFIQSETPNGEVIETAEQQRARRVAEVQRLLAEKKLAQ